MERLDARDVSAVASLVGELRDVDDPLACSPRVLELLRGLIRSLEAAYSELDHGRRRFDLQIWTNDDEHGVEWGERAKSSVSLEPVRHPSRVRLSPAHR